jgi:hypothetical protein
VHCEIKYAYLIQLDSKDGSRKPGQPAAVNFVFNLIAKKTPAKMSCKIDMRQPRESRCGLIFNDFDSKGSWSGHEQT